MGKDFSTWIKDRIAAYGFAEGLPARGVAAPRGGAWTATTVRRVLAKAG